jgi:hypothetical protein
MKTTITGLLLATLTALQPYLSSGEIDFGKNWFQYLIAVLVGALGYLANDPKGNLFSKDGDDIGGGGIKNPKP